MIERNRNLDGRLSNIAFGLCAIADGLVRVLSLGFLHTRLTLEYTRRMAKRRFQKARQAAEFS